MQINSSEYTVLRSLPLNGLGDRIRQDYPTGRTTQWWLSIVNSAETEVIAVIHRGQPVSIDAFRFAARLLDLGVQDSVDLAKASDWVLRFAALAVRAGALVKELPLRMTPNGSAAYALAGIPLTKEQAIAMSRRRNQELTRDDRDHLADLEMREIQDTELIVSSLKSVRDNVTDTDLAAEIDAWLKVYDQMAPG
jgi:hypothetical protein